MAAYAEALKIIFPGRAIEAKLLYTAGPVLHDLAPDLLERHLPASPALEQADRRPYMTDPDL
jgi:ATP-dependent helicase/nuclease subunit A